MIRPTSPYWPLTGWVEYNYLKVSAGKWNPKTLAIEVQGPSTLADRFRRTHVEVPGLQYPCVAILDTRPGVVPLPDWSNVEKTLYQGLYVGDKAPAYLGETGDRSVFGWEPECELTLAPKAGEELRGTCKGMAWDPVTGRCQPDSLDWLYKTLGFGTGPGETFWWPQYPGQVISMLQERPEQAEGWVYNYLFAKNVGLINFWWGWKRADNSMDPKQFWQWQITGFKL